MEQLKQHYIAKNGSSPFVDEVLEFIDLDTIPERMKAKHSYPRNERPKWKMACLLHHPTNL